MQLIKDMKAVPVIMDYKEHDYTVAAISHVPHLIAAGLTRTVKTNDDDEKHMHLLAAGGFRDTTRIAASSPEMWSQICNSNKDSICTFLDKFIEEMHNIRKKHLNLLKIYLKKPAVIENLSKPPLLRSNAEASSANKFPHY